MIDDNPLSQKHNGWHCCDLQPQGIKSRALSYSRKSLLHTWITYYTELPMKVPITPHRLENRYYATPPIAITGNRLTRVYPPSPTPSSPPRRRGGHHIVWGVDALLVRLCRGRHPWDWLPWSLGYIKNICVVGLYRRVYEMLVCVCKRGHPWDWPIIPVAY